jgi:hypothetical protein
MTQKRRPTQNALDDNPQAKADDMDARAIEAQDQLERDMLGLWLTLEDTAADCL